METYLDLAGSNTIRAPHYGILFVLLLLADTIHAQTVTVVNTVPENAVVNVPLQSNVSFTFSQPFASASEIQNSISSGSEFAEGRGPWSSEPVLSADGKTITYMVEHLPETDYWWYVYDVSNKGERDEGVASYVLHYTTASSLGTGMVRGTIEIGSDVSSNDTFNSTSGALELRSHPNLSRLFSRYTLEHTPLSVPPNPESLSKNTLPSSRLISGDRRTHAGSATRLDPAESIIFLFKSGELYEIGAVAGVAVPQADGSYHINHVRPGTYVPLALGAFYEPSATEPTGALGFLDLNEDLWPDEITVNNDTVSGVQITLHRQSFYAVASDVFIERARAFLSERNPAPDYVLVAVNSGGGIERTPGRFLDWRAQFYSRSQGHIAEIEQEPGLFMHLTTLGWGAEGYRPVPTAAASSETVIKNLQEDERAMEFFQKYDNGLMQTVMSGGDYVTCQQSETGIQCPYPDRIIWRIHISAFDSNPQPNQIAILEAHADMASGEVLDVKIEEARTPATAKTYAVEARTLAETELSETDTLRLLHISSAYIDPETGTSNEWKYTYTISEQQSIEVTLFRLGTNVLKYDFQILPPDKFLVPEEYIDSDSAFQKAEAAGGAAYRSEVGEAYAVLSGGNTSYESTNVNLTGKPLWTITYYPTNSFTMPFEVVIDMITGEVLAVDGSPVSTGYETEQPTSIVLQPAYPNPFNLSTTIPFSLTNAEHVTIKVYDLLGRDIATLVDGLRPAGIQEVRWDAKTTVSGVYIVRMAVREAMQTQKIILHK